MSASGSGDAARIAIIGGGAIGGVVAAILAGLGGDVTLCVRRRPRRMIVEINGAVHDVPVRISDDPAHESIVDWVMLATKVQDTPGAVRWFDNLVGPETVVAVLQNGIDHIERVGSLLRQGRVLPVLVHIAAELVAPGHIRHYTGQRLFVPAGRDGVAFAGLFEGGSLVVDRIDDFTTAAWRKLFGNVAVNPITALTCRRIGIMRDPGIRAFAHGLLAEAVMVGCAAGANLRSADIDRILDAFANHNPESGSSMLYDRLAGRPMEHEHLTGAVVRTAERFGIAVPLNRGVLALLRAIDRSPIHGMIETTALSEEHPR